MNTADLNELNLFLSEYPDTTMLEVLSPDINGILRGKRIPTSEFESFFNEGVKSPGSVSLCNSRGEFSDDVDMGGFEGDPDYLMRPLANTIAPISWLKSDTAQVLSSFANLDGSPAMFDPRNVLIKALSLSLIHI